MKKEIKKFTLADLEKLAEGKEIFGFRPYLEIQETNVQSLLIGRIYPSIEKACSLECHVVICPERESYAKTIIGFFPPDSCCAKRWELSYAQFGVETLVKIGDPLKNRVTPIGIYEPPSGKYALLKVSEEIYFLWEVGLRGDRVNYINYIEPVSE